MLAGDSDVVIFMTGVGAKALFEVLARPIRPQAPGAGAATGDDRSARTEAGARAARVGVEPTLEIPEPNTWREVLSELARHTEPRRQARRGAGIRSLQSRSDCRAWRRAAPTVMLVPVYRWALPEDREPLHRALAAIASGTGRGGPVHQRHSGQPRAPGGRGARMRAPLCAAALARDGRGIDRSGLLRRAARAWPAGRRGAFASQAGPSDQGNRGRAASNSGPQTQPAPAIVIEIGAVRVPPRPDSPQARIRRPSDDARLPDEANALHADLADAPGGPLHAGIPSGARALLVSGNVRAPRRGGRGHASTAVQRLKVDAAIIFADILLPLLPMGVGLHYEKGDGPIIDRPVRSSRRPRSESDRWTPPARWASSATRSSWRARHLTARFR